MLLLGGRLLTYRFENVAYDECFFQFNVLCAELTRASVNIAMTLNVMMSKDH